MQDSLLRSDVDKEDMWRSDRGSVNVVNLSNSGDQHCNDARHMDCHTVLVSSLARSIGVVFCICEMVVIGPQQTGVLREMGPINTLRTF